MNKQLQSIKILVNNFITIAKKQFLKKKNKIAKPLPYIALSPTDNAEDCDVYLESLSWALANKKNIKNIAISGPYGSGKSSILETFIRKGKQCHFYNKKWFSKRNHFLKISLATFESLQTQNGDATNEENKNNPNLSKNDLQRRIELSLLQQLFFREKYSKTPDSRLKRIKRLKSWMLIIESIAFIIFIFSIIILWFPSILNNIIEYIGINVSSPYLKLIAFILLVIGLFMIIYKSSRSIISLSIKKLNLKGAEIEIDKNISKSILNNHIDEIIYFFEVTNYNVVIIEDLDRFGESEIFTKLREINLLINNSKKIKREIVFIYAIKDDMFQDKDRAKFFDYIIPVIPIVNFSNSGDKLKKMLKGSSIKIDNELIDDLSMFIDDMRLIYNIMNEFHVYATKVSSQLDMNKLLAIIVYKNLYPKDFVDLSENKGDLFDTINSKNKYIQETVLEIDKKIEKIKEKINLLEGHFITNIKDLRTLYISKVLEHITDGFVSFQVGNTRINFSDFTKDEYFNIIKSGEIIYYHHIGGFTSKENYSYNFHDIEKALHPTLTYAQRESTIIEKQGINIQRKELEKLYDRKSEVRKSKLKDLLSKGEIKSSKQQNKKRELIDILLKNGYINENYMDYISIFHEGSLSKTDYQFLINVKREISSQFDYVINKREELIKRISIDTFEKKYILNFDIVDTLLECNFDQKTKVLFKQLANENELTIRFINEYIDRSKVQNIFVREICSYWPNIWKYILFESNFTKERKELYFLLILKYASIDDLEKIFDKNDSSIATYRDFFIIEMNNKVRHELIKYLGIHFRTINPESSKENLQFLRDNCYYEINEEMLMVIISKDKFHIEEDFYTNNYSYIKHSGINSIVEYIEDNINTYVENILLGIKRNTKEDIKEYTLLLNNSDLNLNLKEKLIEKIDTIINDISTIEGLDEVHILFKNSKVKPTWENIQSTFEKEDNILSESIFTFLNNMNNSNTLSKNKMSLETYDDGRNIFGLLSDAIIHSKNISDESYCLLLKSIPWWYNSFDANSISIERMKVLIAHGKVNPTIESYNYLLQNYKGLNIQLIEKYTNKFIELLDETTVDQSDMEILLNSSKLDDETKFKYVNTVDNSVIINSDNNSKFVIRHVLLNTSKYNISDELQYLLINKKELLVSQRISLFILIYKHLSDEEINTFLISLGNPYMEIVNTNKNPEIDRNSTNEKLMEILISRNIISKYSNKNNRIYHSD